MLPKENIARVSFLILTGLMVLVSFCYTMIDMHYLQLWRTLLWFSIFFFLSSFMKCWVPDTTLDRYSARENSKSVCLAFYPDIYYQNKVIKLHDRLVGVKQPMRKELADSNQPINGQRDGSSTRPAKNFQSVSRLGQLQSSAAVPEDQTLQLYGPAQLVIFSILLLHGGDWWCVSSVDD
jgi:hypothetical protein